MQFVIDAVLRNTVFYVYKILVFLHEAYTTGWPQSIEQEDEDK